MTQHAIDLEGAGARPLRPAKLRELVRDGFPRPGVGREANAWRLRNCWRLIVPLLCLSGIRLFQRGWRVPLVHGSLYLRVDRADGSSVDLGLACLRVVTTAGVTKIVDFLRANDTTTATNFKFHGIGTGTNAEAAGDTALQTEITTEYSTNNTRPTGSQTNNGATVYRTAATVLVDASVACTEHGVLTQAATGGGTLLDRSVFSVVNLGNGDSLSPTYDLTCSAGG